MVISKDASVLDSIAFEGWITRYPSAKTELELLSPVIEKFGSELLATQKS